MTRPKCAKKHRLAGIVAAVVFVMSGGALLHGEDTTSVAVFVTLPMTDGFADATHALVETKDVVRQAVAAAGDVRLVGHAEEADVVLTVLGRGRGDAELNAAVKMLENDVSASPVAIATNERFIQIMVTVGSCLRSPTRDVKDRGHCYKHVFVGLGLDRDAPKPPKKPNVNTWDTCAAALARDVRAWLRENASRIVTYR
jgi:hypothetical protein